MHTVPSILTYVRGYRNSSVKKVRINKQPGRFLNVIHEHAKVNSTGTNFLNLIPTEKPLLKGLVHGWGQRLFTKFI